MKLKLKFWDILFKILDEIKAEMLRHPVQTIR